MFDSKNELSPRLQHAAEESPDDIGNIVREVGLERVVDIVVDKLRSQSSIFVPNPVQYELKLSHEGQVATRSLVLNVPGPDARQISSNDISRDDNIVDFVTSVYNRDWTDWTKSQSSLHGFLNRVHEHLQPSSYFEIGVAAGHSLALSRAKSVGVDPEFFISAALNCNVTLYRMTSDKYFASTEDPLSPFDGYPIDFAFIDGLHRLEYVLRDFIYMERNSHASSVIICDDMLPTDVDMAARQRRMGASTGDIFKLPSILNKYRNDLICLTVDTKPTGVLVVFGTDPNNDTLSRHYDNIVDEYVTPDPQNVPEHILTRSRSVDPLRLLDTPVWEILRENRVQNISREDAINRISNSLRPLMAP